MAGDRITQVTRAVTKSRNLEEIEVRTCICTWLALSKPKKYFHAAVSVPKQRVFSHKIVFQQKNLLAGISRRQNFPERTLTIAHYKDETPGISHHLACKCRNNTVYLENSLQFFSQENLLKLLPEKLHKNH